jgi:hypothetical protein
MPKRRVLKNRNEEQEQQQEQHVEEEQQESQSTNEPHQPQRKITQFVNGQQKEYHYRTTVKSFEELDKFQFQVNAKKIIKVDQ